MSREVEVSLRVPNMKVRALDENGYPIDHSAVRFKKMIQVPAIPKPDETLELSTSSGRTFAARVTRADWHEGRGLFVVSCQYRKPLDLPRGVWGAGRRSRMGAQTVDLEPAIHEALPPGPPRACVMLVIYDPGAKP